MKIVLYLGELLENQQERAFVWCPVFFGFGIALYLGLKTEPLWWPALPGMIGAGALLVWLWPRRDTHILAYSATFILLLISAGFGMAQFRAHQIYTPMLLKKQMPVGITGTVQSVEPLDEGDGVRVMLSSVAIEDMPASATPRLIRLSVRQENELNPGQIVSGLAGLNPPSPPVAPGAFDFQRQAFFKSIGAVGFFYRPPEIIGETPGAGFSTAIEKLRLSIGKKIEDALPQPQAGIATTLMTGQRRATAQDDIEAMRDSGLAHLLAISGMHVGMIAAAVFFFSRLLMAGWPWLALHHPIKKYAAFLALAAAIFYTLIAGMTVPTQRALLMTGIALIAIMLDRSPFSLRLVAFAALVVLLIAPEGVASVSFQMSFAAVFCLIAFYDWIRPFLSAAYRQAGFVRRSALYMIGVFLTSLIAGFATGLFSLFHFQTFALYGLLANLIAVPLMGVVVMPMAVCALFAMPFGAENIFLEGMGWGVTWILATAHWVAGLDGAVLQIPSFSFFSFAGITVFSLATILWKGRGKIVFAALIIPFIVLAFFTPRADIFVSDTASLMAVKQEEGLLSFSGGRGDKYAAQNWLRLNGEDETSKRRLWPKEGQAGFLTCDVLACRYEKDGQRISLLRSPRAMHEECGWASLVIADFPIKQCAADKIDRFSVWREGAHSVRLGKNALIIKTVEEQRGRRLWTQTAANQKED